MTDRIEIENLVEDYLPGPDDNANDLSFLSEQIRKRLASNEENHRKRERLYARRRLKALQENLAAGQASAGEDGAKQGVFERYSAPAAEGSTFEGDRGDAFDGCFDDKPAAGVTAVAESPLTVEENVFEETSESDIIIDDNSLNLFDGGFGAPENEPEVKRAAEPVSERRRRPNPLPSRPKSLRSRSARAAPTRSRDRFSKICRASPTR